MYLLSDIKISPFGLGLIGIFSDVNNNLIEEEILLTFVTGVTGKLIQNKKTGLIQFTVSLNSSIANGTSLTTLPVGTRPTSTQSCRNFAKQTTGIGRCILTVDGVGNVGLSAVDYNEPLVGATFNLWWKA